MLLKDSFLVRDEMYWKRFVLGERSREKLYTSTPEFGLQLMLFCFVLEFIFLPALNKSACACVCICTGINRYLTTLVLH